MEIALTDIKNPNFYDEQYIYVGQIYFSSDPLDRNVILKGDQSAETYELSNITICDNSENPQIDSLIFHLPPELYIQFEESEIDVYRLRLSI